MEDQFFITVNNEHSRKYFPRNSASKFQVALDQTINFQDKYECALVDFMCTTKNFDDDLRDIYIYLDICTEQLIGGSRGSLVRFTTVDKGQGQMEKFNYPYYVNVKPMNTNQLEVYIKDRNGKDASFLTETTTCTFHLRKIK